MIAQSFRISLIYFAVISSALSAGVFFAFSTFVMRALALQPSASGIATMQSINITVFNPWFYSGSTSLDRYQAALQTVGNLLNSSFEGHRNKHAYG